MVSHVPLEPFRYQLEQHQVLLQQQLQVRPSFYVNNNDRAREALEEFEMCFGSMTNNIYAWKELCMLSGMPPSSIPSNICQCKDFLKTVYVNIFDLVEARREERLAKPVFSSATELRLYSQETGKICPANMDGKRGKGMSSPLWRFCLKRWY